MIIKENMKHEGTFETTFEKGFSCLGIQINKNDIIFLGLKNYYDNEKKKTNRLRYTFK